MHNRDSGISVPSTSAQNIQLRSVVGNLTMIIAVLAMLRKPVSTYTFIFLSPLFQMTCPLQSSFTNIHMWDTAQVYKEK